MLVAAGKAEAAAAIGAFVGPHGGLRPTLGIEDVLVGALRIYIRPIAHILAGFGRKDGSDLAHAVLAKAHIEVPFIHHLEGFHAVGDRVFGEGFEIRRPMGFTENLCS